MAKHEITDFINIFSKGILPTIFPFKIELISSLEYCLAEKNSYNFLLVFHNPISLIVHQFLLLLES
jgi:hypothetical protein